MEAGIKVNVKKCNFFAPKVTFLGHEIDKGGIKKSQEYIEKVENYPKPKNVTEMRQFLGLANFQRKFVPQFAAIAKPLTSITGGPKKKKIEWNADMEQAFLVQKIKV